MWLEEVQQKFCQTDKELAALVCDQINEWITKTYQRTTEGGQCGSGIQKYPDPEPTMLCSSLIYDIYNW